MIPCLVLDEAVNADGVFGLLRDVEMPTSLQAQSHILQK
jgi:hypothetical protein